MKKVLLSLLCVAFASMAWAEDLPKKPSCAGFVSNGFWDNWEVSGGLGVGTAFSTGKNLGSFGNRIGFEGNFSVTKWTHPIFGVRLQLQGGKFNTFSRELGQQKWPYLFVHTDALINFSNWVGGYREDRAYYGVPFVGFGYMATNFTDKSQRETRAGTGSTFAMSFGWLSKFRISPAVDFNIELKSLLAPSRVVPSKMDGAYLFGMSATAGFTYRFNKRGWERGVGGYTAKDIRAFQQAVADGHSALEAAHAENTRLNDALKAAQADAEAAKATAAAKAARAAAAEKAAAEAKANASMFVLYDYGMAVLTPKEKTRLDLLAEKIKQGPADRVYNIDGHADYQTGTASANQKLSEKRAKAVYDYLVKQGVNPDQLTFQGKGDKANPFPVQKANRSVVVE